MRNIALGSGIGCATMALAPLASADTMSGIYKATVFEDDHHYESLADTGRTMTTAAWRRTHATKLTRPEPS
jgi:hypothetical protein